MLHKELADTLITLIAGVEAPPEAGLLVTEVLLDVPLEISLADEQGQPIILGGVPHTRWISGFLPPVHLSHLHIVALTHNGNPLEPESVTPDQD